MTDINTPGAINGTILYHYEPSLPLATAFCAAFGVTTVLHAYQMSATRSWYMTPIVIGGACETIGYICRILGANDYPQVILGPYIIQSILLLVAPALIAASIYMIMGYVIQATQGDRYSLLRERVLTKVFVIGDIFSFMVQSTGAGLLTKNEQDSKDAGNWIIIGGLAIQLIFFGFFIAVTILFWARLTADKPRSSQLKYTGIHWRLQLWILFVSSILIMVRSVFRVVEYVQGQDGYLLTHEVYLYIFDAALMFMAVVIFNFVHPTRVSGLVKTGKVVHNVVRVEAAELRAITDKSRGQGSDEETAYAPVSVGMR